MPIRFTCPNDECHATIAVKDEFAGRKGKCPSCKMAVTVPAASMGPSPAVAVSQPPAAVPVTPPAAPVAKSAPPPADPGILGRSYWICRRDQRVLKKDTIGLFETPKSTDPIAQLVDTTRKIFGLFDKVFWITPKQTFELREGDQVLLSFERIKPGFTLPMFQKPVRWEIRVADGELIGTVNLCKSTAFSYRKMLKGRIFQDDHFISDAQGVRVGSLAMERGAMARPLRFFIQGQDGPDYCSFGSQAGDQAAQLQEDAKAGKRKVAVSVNVMGKGDEEWRGGNVSVNPERQGERFAHIMTLAVALMIELIGFDYFLGTESPR